MDDLRALKDKAAQLAGKGKLDKAAEIYREVLAADPRDLASRQKLAETLRKAGEDAGAIAAYREVADAFARDGLLIKAIAICKVILELDPDHGDTQSMLAGLYGRKHVEAPAPRLAAPLQGEAPGRPTGFEPIPLDEGSGREISLEPLAGGVPSEAPPHRAAAPEAGGQPGGEESGLPPELEPALAPAAEDEESTLFEIICFAALEARQAGVGDDVVIDAQEPIEEATASPSAATPSRLPRIPLFSDLSPAAFVALTERMTLRRAAPGEAVVQEGEVGESFFVVASGRLRVEKRDEAGAKVALARLGEGTFFGEMALLSGAPRAASVVAEEESELLEIRAEVLEDLCRQHPHVADSLARFYRQRLLANAMATSPLFRPFDTRDRKAIMERFRAREMAAGERIVLEGQPSDGLYVVLSGALDVLKRKGGEVVPAGALREGDVFGEMSCLRKGPASATVVARRAGTLLRLPRAAFDELIVTYPQILELVSELTDERQQSLEAILAGAAAWTEEGLVLV
jgi:CRP-like cAMP-binding protein